MPTTYDTWLEPDDDEEEEVRDDRDDEEEMEADIKKHYKES